ncbi:hypothetical protein F5X96DRAFT_692086 [Biscogniauxia mediterranea]|nr:hypothetical protein F5X96DRAFT_692086 [Biscogniauxia mediterranea]
MDQPTLGIELEFMLAVCPNTFPKRPNPSVDPHPDDPRWCSSKLGALDWTQESKVKADEGEDDDDYMGDYTRRLYHTCRNKLVRILRSANLTAIKVPDVLLDPDEEDLDFLDPTTFDETDASDDEAELPYPNANVLVNFNPPAAVWDPNASEETNLLAARGHFITQFVRYHLEQGLRMHRTRATDIENIANRLQFAGAWPYLKPQECRDAFFVNVSDMVWAEKRCSEVRRNTQVDPLHVPVEGIADKYRAWTATNDASVDGNGMVARRYRIPPHRRAQRPMQEYKYFGAEVVSPVLPADHPQTYEAIRAACGALRNALRIHKPMVISTGFHVHLGHRRGWNLLQLKKLATLWFLTEDILLHLHREDRGTDKKWCAKIGEGSKLWAALFSQDRIVWEACMPVLPKVAPGPTKDRNEAAMRANVPVERLGDREVDFLWNLWQLPSITRLAEALTGHQRSADGFQIRTGLRWRVFGGKVTPPAREGLGTQTVEARVMQGTLDADHICHWITLLVHIVAAVRNWDAPRFRDMLRNLLEESPQTRVYVLFRRLGIDQASLEYWADPRRRDDAGEWWEYPDKDRVDWDQPFMVPGFRATHGAAWD